MKIFLAGHKGLVGSAILRKLKKKNTKKLSLLIKKNLIYSIKQKVFNFLKKKKT